MCGIMGVVGLGREVSVALHDRFEAGLGLMRGRGPDGYWAYADGQALIGQTLLSITDPLGGLRPYVSSDGGIVACANGEIYNSATLRKALEAQGARFGSNSDCEVIAHGYALWGEQLFERLDGMFAIAVLDRRNRVLTIARDRAGIRPLYYTVQDDYVAFASETRVLTTPGLASPEPSEEGLFESLVLRRALDPTTMYKEVRSVVPGQRLTFDRAGQRTACSFASIPPQALDSDGAVPAVDLEAVRQLVTAAVHRRVPERCRYSLFLSGGLDSTIVNALTPEDPARRLPSLGCGFSFADTVDERVMAEEAAAQIKVRLTSHTVTPERFLAIWPLLVWAHHEPLMFNSSIPLFLLCREARAMGAKVILSGEGADEMFAGYAQYPIYAQREDDGTPEYLLRHDVEMNDPDFVVENWLSDQAWGRRHQQMLRDRLDTAVPFKGKRNGLSRKLDFDRMTFLRGLLMRQDSVGLTTGIEVRVPFLDNRVMQEATRHPAASHLRDGVGKQMLRQAFAPLLGKLAGVPKVGFPVPVSAWLENAAFHTACERLNAHLNASGFIRRDAILSTIRDAPARPRESYKFLWTLLNLSMWWSTRTACEPPQGVWKDLLLGGSDEDVAGLVAETRHTFPQGYLRRQLAQRELPAVVLSSDWRTTRVLPLQWFCGVPASGSVARTAPASCPREN